MNATSTRHDPETYKLATVGLSLLAAVALAGGTLLRRPFVGIGIYWLALGSVFVLPVVSNSRMFDERDDRIVGRASAATLTLFGWLSALVYPSLVALSATGQFSWGPATTAVAFTTVAVYATFGAAVAYVRYR
ncbi:DUF2178 domain-containing protein [Halobacteriales archaeon SW_12_69_24]|nr:MAG: DUF2178 domain-containing protein [Halobacteriales archaeon SW_12_69_24]